VSPRPRLVGINHVALEVADLEQALAFYGEIFDLELVDREPGMAFIEIGDQFIALTQCRGDAADEARHFGLVVNDKNLVRASLQRAGVEILPGHRLDFRDPWGNRIQIVDYRDIQFTKSPPLLRGMGMERLEKRPAALAELRSRGLL
jgi:catechol 2,3-dioxygenase-like lactoylglutathione lyase family enzyme